MTLFAPDGAPLHNPYELLDLEHGCSDEDIGKQFKKLMLKLHPDKQSATLTDEEREKATLDFHQPDGRHKAEGQKGYGGLKSSLLPAVVIVLSARTHNPRSSSSAAREGKASHVPSL